MGIDFNPIDAFFFFFPKLNLPFSESLLFQVGVGMCLQTP